MTGRPPVPSITSSRAGARPPWATRRWHKLDNPQGYLYRIAANLVSDHWRKAGRERRAIIEGDLVPRDASRPAEGPRAAELALEGRDGTGAPAHVWETIGGSAWRVPSDSRALVPPQPRFWSTLRNDEYRNDQQGERVIADCEKRLSGPRLAFM